MWLVSVRFPFYRLSYATRDCRLLETAAFLTLRQQLVCTRQREEETSALQLLPKLFQKQLGDTLEHPQTGKFFSPDPAGPPPAPLNIHHGLRVVLGICGLKADKQM